MSPQNDRFAEALGNLQALDGASPQWQTAPSVFDEYVLSAPDLGERNFAPFCRLFGRFVSRLDDLSYNAAELALARRAMQTPESAELFDELKTDAFRGDARGLEKIARAIGDNADKKQSVCPGFAARTQKFFADQIWRHSFTDEEILRLQNTLGRRLPNPRIEEILRAAARETGLVHKQKRNRDMRSLNRWAMAFNSDDLLKKLSFRNTYINVAYARLVRQTDTKDLAPEELYRRHRLDVQKQVRDLTGTRDAKGKEICRKYAVNKVYKAIAGQDKFKLQCVQHALAKYRDEAFCRETAAILAALDGGDKNRNVLLPADFAKSQNGGGR